MVNKEQLMQIIKEKEIEKQGWEHALDVHEKSVESTKQKIESLDFEISLINERIKELDD